jgi:hypothetical protein
VRGVADDRLHPGDPAHHHGQVRPVTEITPVRDHATAQADRPAEVEDLPGRVTEPVHPGCVREPGGQRERRSGWGGAGGQPGEVSAHSGRLA